MSLSNFIFLKEKDFFLIQRMEKELLDEQKVISHEKEFILWNAPWRMEGLKHYVDCGMIGGIFEEKSETLEAYFLAQPIGFFLDQTHCLWVEHLQSKESEQRVELVEVLMSLARSKNFSKLFFKKTDCIKRLEGQFPLEPRGNVLELSLKK